MACAHIIGTGSYVPKKVISNQDLERIVETNDAWIAERTGIRARHQAAQGEATSDMAVQAARAALDMAGVKPEELDLIIVGTITADMPMPSCAVMVQAKLGARKAFAFDVAAACAGSLYAMTVADQFIRSGQVKRALVIGAELLSRVVNWEDRNTCVLFGDGAGAMVLAPSPDGSRGIRSTHLHSDGTTAGLITIPAGGSLEPASEASVRDKRHTLHMQGKEVFRFAVRALAETAQEALAAEGLTPEQVDHVIAHQANTRILESVLDRVRLPREKCWLNIHKYGNTSSASLPMSLDEANRAGRLKAGDVIAMLAIGAGMAWGSAVVRW